MASSIQASQIPWSGRTQVDSGDMSFNVTRWAYNGHGTPNVYCLQYHVIYKQLECSNPINIILIIRVIIYIKYHHYYHHHCYYHSTIITTYLSILNRDNSGP